MRPAASIPILVIASLFVSRPTAGAIGNVKTVCTADCDYASLQAAVDAVKALGSSASSPWVIRIEPGVLVEDSTPEPGKHVYRVTIDGLSYLTIEGSGDFASIVRASPSFFSAAAALGSSEDRAAEHFITVKNSNHVTIRGVQIDGVTNVLVPGAGGSGQPMSQNGDGVASVVVENSNPVLIENSTVLGYQWGVRDATPPVNGSPMNNRIDIYNSRIKTQHIATWATGGTSWFIWSSDFESQGDLTANTPSGFAEALYVTGSGSTVNRVSAWGSYFHAATSNLATNRAADIDNLKDHDIVTITGCTLHGISTAPETIGLGAEALFLSMNSAKARLDIVGSELIYEAPPAAPTGSYHGINIQGQMPLGVVGSAILDLARDEVTGQQAGGTTGNLHADVFRQTGGGFVSPVRMAGSRAVRMTGNSSTVPQAFNTVELQAGTAILVNGSKSVDLPVPLPGPNYRVVLSVNNNGETVSVSNKTDKSFTISSSSATSSSTVDWMVRF